MSQRSLDDYVRHIERFGPDGIVDVAAADLDESALAELRRRLGEPESVECSTPGCPVVFVPGRKGQRYHSDACRQKADRIRRGQEGAEHRRGGSGRAQAGERPASPIRVTKTMKEGLMSIERRDDAGFEPEARLEQLAEEIGEEVRLAAETWHKTVGHAIRAGEKLIEAKTLVMHGQWLPWLRDNFDGSERTASLYMRLARNSAKVADFPTVREAIALLTEPRAEAKHAEVEADADWGPQIDGLRRHRWSDEWRSMSNDVRRANLAATRGVVDALLRESKARGEDEVEVPRWTLEPIMWAIGHQLLLFKSARDGNMQARAEVEEMYRLQGKRVVWSH